MNDIEAIEVLKELNENYFSDDFDEANEAIEIAMSALEHQLTNGWIPVLERLPERGIWCLISAKCGMVGEGQYIPNKKCFSYNGHYMETIAWKPLPEPYKEAQP